MRIAYIAVVLLTVLLTESYSQESCSPPSQGPSYYCDFAGFDVVQFCYLWPTFNLPNNCTPPCRAYYDITVKVWGCIDPYTPGQYSDFWSIRLMEYDPDGSGPGTVYQQGFLQPLCEDPCNSQVSTTYFFSHVPAGNYSIVIQNEAGRIDFLGPCPESNTDILVSTIMYCERP